MSCERQIYRLRQIFYRQILRQEISWFDLNGCGDLTKKLSGYENILVKYIVNKTFTFNICFIL